MKARLFALAAISAGAFVWLGVYLSHNGHHLDFTDAVRGSIGGLSTEAECYDMPYVCATLSAFQFGPPTIRVETPLPHMVVYDFDVEGANGHLYYHLTIKAEPEESKRWSSTWLLEIRADRPDNIHEAKYYAIILWLTNELCSDAMAGPADGVLWNIPNSEYHPPWPLNAAWWKAFVKEIVAHICKRLCLHGIWLAFGKEDLRGGYVRLAVWRDLV